MTNKIQFHKWVDPLAFLPKHEEDDDENEIQGLNKRFHGPIVMGPHGIFPIDVHNIPSKQFNFWEANTTFKMTGAIVEIINLTDGVETLDIFTPYRFRMAIGKLFDEKIVKETLTNRLLEYLNNTHENDTDEENIVKMCTAAHKFWALLFTNSNDPRPQKIFKGETKEEVEKKIEEAQKNGLLFKRIRRSYEI